MTAVTTRAELEAVIWRNGAATPAQVDAILAAAEQYALATYGITADRRRELAEATRKPRSSAA